MSHVPKCTVWCPFEIKGERLQTIGKLITQENIRNKTITLVREG